MMGNQQYSKKRNPNFRQTLYAQVNSLAHRDGQISAYMKWNGTKEGDCSELDEKAIYRILNVIPCPTVTLITIQNIFTGIILEKEYDLDLFSSLKGHSGYSDKLPELGKEFKLFELDFSSKTHFEKKISNVLWIEHVGEQLWNIITDDDVYNIITPHSWLK